ncbi:hypothetical protein MPSEU_000828300 [Mayamaea pseudoterrestris]|nr:hypothetical protein MPSEU_000828300 [Mayamaea pseudoterrestris]
MSRPRCRSVTLAVLLLQTCTTFSAAFTLSSSHVRRPSTQHQSSLTALQSSNQNTPDDNEINKLIGKRDQIKRKRQEDMEQKVEQLAEKIGPVVDFDLDSLPEFQTLRIARNNKESDDSSSKTRSKETDAKKQQDFAIIDFLADYSDENDFHVPNRMGISTVAWGDASRNFVLSSGGGKSKSTKLSKQMMQAGKFVAGDVLLAHRTCLMGGLSLIETSSSYGASAGKQQQSSCDLVQQCLSAAQADGLPETLLVASAQSNAPWNKIVAPWRPNKVVSDLESTLTSMKMEMLELFTLPKSRFAPSAMVAKSLAAAIESGLCLYVGVEGETSAGTLKRIQRKLEDRDVILTSNTFEFSLTNRKHAKMLDVCKSLGVIPLIRNPLDGGLASGVYTATNPSGGQAGTARGKFSFKQLDKLQPLHSVLETVAERVETRVRREANNVKEKFQSRAGPPKINTDITTTQVALHYVIAKGGVPLPEVNTLKQANEVLGCLGWTLTDEEVSMLDSAAALCEL